MWGGLVALEGASIATGLTFIIVLLIVCYSAHRGLQKKHYHAKIIEKMQPETQKIEIPAGKLNHPLETVHKYIALITLT
jgi:choline-glycine betaine transporter